MPLPPPEGRPLQATGARRRTPHEPPAAELVRRIRQLGAGEGLVALLDAAGVAGERHLLSAWAHLGRARGRGAQRLRDRNAEFLLYVAGDDQLPRALEKVGVGPTTEEFVLVVEKPRELGPTLEALGLVAAAELFPRPAGPAVLDRLGIGEVERQTVGAPGYEGLVLERVALLELTGGAASGPTPSRRSGKV